MKQKTAEAQAVRIGSFQSKIGEIMDGKEKEFIIPHNYKENGRIFNFFTREAVTKILIVLIPLTIIIFYVLPVSITVKCFLETLLGGFPVAIFATGIDEALINILSFQKNKRIYYDLRWEDTDEYQSIYEKLQETGDNE